ncbi:MAG: tRNA pseudouridine(13) synthase TruD [Gammaproteobacteria bacterium]|nr:tRNA pseudouridine(13) synthase TruD [Gammaproteobacteria bacterium]
MSAAAQTDCFIAPNDLPRAFPAPPGRGRIKQTPEDFQVDEVLGFEPDGEGGHAWLRIRKRGANTRWVAGRLARLAGVRERDVGYAGLKDRAALTSQWFSVPMDGRDEPDWGALERDDVEVLEVTRSRRKLRRGVQAGNRFRILVRDFEGDSEAIERRAETIAGSGVPNYFGAQRFGRDAGNIEKAADMLAGGRRVRDRALRGIYLSAVRAMLFNRVLARRVEEASWQHALPGEALMLDGSHSVFVAVEPDADIAERLARLDVHPTGPLWGSGERLAIGEALALERSALEPCTRWCEGLADAGLAAARRALRVPVADLRVATEAAGTLEVAFSLPAGAYATMVLRELVETAWL